MEDTEQTVPVQDVAAALAEMQAQLDEVGKERDRWQHAYEEKAERLQSFRQGKMVYGRIIDVMREVTHVAKDGRNTDQNYNFRGVDGVVNALGPAMRKHGLFVVPELISSTHRDTLTVRDNKTREATVRIRFTFYAEDGSSIDAEVEGESLDTSDKGTAKAFSVAYRIVLLQVFALPTQEPTTDDDGQYHTRGGGNGLTGWAARTVKKALTDRDAAGIIDGWEAIVEAEAAEQKILGGQETWAEAVARTLSEIIEASWDQVELKELWGWLKAAELNVRHAEVTLSDRIKARAKVIDQARSEAFDAAMKAVTTADSLAKLGQLAELINQRHAEGKLTVEQCDSLVAIYTERQRKLGATDGAVSEPSGAEQPEENRDGEEFLPAVGHSWDEFVQRATADLDFDGIRALLLGDDSDLTPATEFGQAGLVRVTDAIRRAHRATHTIDNGQRAELESEVADLALATGIKLPDDWRR